MYMFRGGKKKKRGLGVPLVAFPGFHPVHQAQAVLHQGQSLGILLGRDELLGGDQVQEDDGVAVRLLAHNVDRSGLVLLHGGAHTFQVLLDLCVGRVADQYINKRAHRFYT